MMKDINELIQHLEYTAKQQAKINEELTVILQRLRAEDSTGDDLQVYKDSTGKLIDQPEVHMMHKEEGTILPADFINGIFYDVDNESWRMDYKTAMKYYWVVMTGERIACYANCVFNKYDGCTIKPTLTIGADTVQICSSIIRKQ